MLKQSGEKEQGFCGNFAVKLGSQGHCSRIG